MCSDPLLTPATFMGSNLEGGGVMSPASPLEEARRRLDALATQPPSPEQPEARLTSRRALRGHLELLWPTE